MENLQNELSLLEIELENERKLLAKAKKESLQSVNIKKEDKTLFYMIGVLAVILMISQI